MTATNNSIKCRWCDYRTALYTGHGKMTGYSRLESHIAHYHPQNEVYDAEDKAYFEDKMFEELEAERHGLLKAGAQL